VMASVSLILTLPALILFVATPEAFTSRADAGTAATGGWIWKYDMSGEGGLIAVLVKKIGLTLAAFGIHWDGPYTVIDQPMLAPLFFVGLAVSICVLVVLQRWMVFAWPFMSMPVLLDTVLISLVVV